MKVKCDYCGKKYDNITNNNRCPVCGYMYEGDRAGDYIIHGAVLGNYGSGMESNDEVADKTANALKKFWYGFFCVVVSGLVVIMDLALLGLNIGKYQRKNNYEERQEKLELAEEQPIEEEIIQYEHLLAGEPIVYIDYNDEKHMIYIKGIKVFEDTKLSIPEGYEMLELSYTVDDGKGETSSNIYGLNIDVFIFTKTGMYIKPLSYEIDDFVCYECDSSFDAKISDSFDFNEGKIYFIVKRDDADDILLQFKHRGENYDDDAIEKNIYIRGIMAE